MLPHQDFKQYISSEALFSPPERILLAVSGGKDSVLMAHLFKHADFNFGIAHCNFNLRSDESQRDEHFVRMLAATLEVPFFVTQFSTKAYAAEHKISTQMAARSLRYQWFEELRQAEGYDYVALAHHQDDAMETVLLNLTRGTGIAGLHGIQAKRNRLIRPMLFLNRAQIDSIMEEAGIAHVEDSSNQADNYARNRIRHHVVPVLKSINPKLEHTFQQNMRRFAETEEVLQQVVEVFKKEIFAYSGAQVSMALDRIADLKPKQLLLFELLRPYGFTESVVADLISSLNHPHTGASFYGAGYVLVVDRDRLILEPMPSAEPTVTFIHAHDTEVSYLERVISMQTYPYGCIERDENAASVDAGKLIYPLVLRSWQQGDRFKPLGLTGFKKLSDFFISQKIPLTQKAGVPLLVNGNGEIIWVAGYRQDDRFKVVAHTRQTIVFRLND
ncbi:tRNA lysidine(34) synthetase TilS [Pedobacter deserti]|uniref:tRNA lysidine(34) synthetase TilS n=1 Tax=Pedobacter deserti TaxID=2817382 RepID=UPI0021095CDE|nr:tRNA lysidine(34) synthetase TilS [Pedobacter sp. SYSU D00382]